MSMSTSEMLSMDWTSIDLSQIQFGIAISRLYLMRQRSEINPVTQVIYMKGCSKIIIEKMLEKSDVEMN